MANPHGSFIWYELITGDAAKALDFYMKVVGWETHSSDGAGFTYHHLRAPDGQDVGGIMEMADGPPPGWLGYIGVSDVDGQVEQIEAAGGSVHVPPTDIPDVGRFAMVADPQGAPFYVMRGDHEGPSTAFAADAPGHVGHNELHAADGAAAFDFYAGQFGWKKGEAMDMGPMGLYQLFNLSDGTPLGGMMTKTPEMPRPMWLPYINVEEIDAAAERVRDNGGCVVMGPHEVPGGSRIIMGTDPEGALFALVAPPRK